jgi:hypothetical protein
MTDQHPITPHRELIEQWASEKVYDERDWLYELHIAHQAARWGADQELLACGNYLEKCASWEPEDVTEFYNYRRPKPPSLNSIALQMLGTIERDAHYIPEITETIRRALKALDD